MIECRYLNIHYLLFVFMCTVIECRRDSTHRNTTAIISRQASLIYDLKSNIGEFEWMYSKTGHARDNIVIDTSERRYSSSVSLTVYKLTIRKVTKQDTGTYTLRNLRSQEEYVHFNLEVWEPPKFSLKIKDSATFDIGGSLTLECGVKNTLPRPVVLWYKGEGSEELHRGQTYVIYNVQRHQAGKYKCTAQLPYPNKMKYYPIHATHYIDVKYVPTISAKLAATVTQFIGSSTYLRCTFISPPVNSDVNFYWMKSNDILTDSSKYRIFFQYDTTTESGQILLTIANLTSADFTSYTCHYSTQSVHYHDTVQLVEKKYANSAMRTIPTDRFIARQTDGVTLTCDPKESSTAISWFQMPSNGKASFISSQRELKLAPVEVSTTYSCQFDHIIYQAHVIVPNTDTCIITSTKDEADNLSLQCSLAYDGQGMHPFDWQSTWKAASGKAVPSLTTWDRGKVVSSLHDLQENGNYLCTLRTLGEVQFSTTCKYQVTEWIMQKGEIKVSLDKFYLYLCGLLIVLFAVSLGCVFYYYHNKISTLERNTSKTSKVLSETLLTANYSDAYRSEVTI